MNSGSKNKRTTNVVKLAGLTSPLFMFTKDTPELYLYLVAKQSLRSEEQNKNNDAQSDCVRGTTAHHKR